jgi:hypothetical protein
MTAPVRKALIGALAAWTFGAGVTMIPTPSLAQGWRGGWHGGYRGGWGGWGWRRGYYGWGAPVAAGVIGGLALGTLAGAAYAYGPYYYGGCSWQNRPVYDSWGNFAGFAPVEVCY